MSRPFLEEIDTLIRARYTMLYVVTWEEERARKLIAQVAGRQRKELFEWSITDGLRRVGTNDGAPSLSERKREPLAALNEILQADREAIYLLKDFHHYLESPETVRQLRDLSAILRRTKKTIVILAPLLKLPPELEKSLTIVDLPLPTYDELKDLLKNSIGGASRSFRVALNEHEQDTLIKAALGLTLIEAENAFAKAIVRDGVLDIDDIDLVNEEKKQVVRKTEVLECVDVGDSIAAVGGMDLLKAWLRKRVRAFGQDARAYGLPQPRGILLMGVQGCGKSLVAKTIASAWHLPLLRMDMSRIFQSYIGSSEQNMRRAVGIAESIAPVVLWIDEIEKAFAGSSGSSASDGGTTSRVLGSFLTWLQEKKAPVFVVATANSIDGLPPELLRKGRLDEIFFVDLPNHEERKEIFSIHFKKVRRDPARFALDELSRLADGFSGAEIEQAIISGLHDSFFENREVDSNDILRNIRDTVPLSKTMREKIGVLRQWSHDRARPVSTHQRQLASSTSTPQPAPAERV